MTRFSEVCTSIAEGITAFVLLLTSVLTLAAVLGVLGLTALGLHDQWQRNHRTLDDLAWHASAAFEGGAFSRYDPQYEALILGRATQQPRQPQGLEQ